MGYYSEVLVILAKELADELNTTLQDKSIDNESRNALRNLLNNADHHLTDKKTGDELWHWELIKWYNERPDVKLIVSILSKASDYNYLFIRIGEDYSDTKVIGNHYNSFNVEFVRIIYYSKTS